MKTLFQKIETLPECEAIFTDFFDTLVHRTVHPQYALKLWGKFMIRELGLLLSAEELFAIRIDSQSYLAEKQQKRTLEVSYESVITEVHSRLINVDALPNTSFTHFKEIFEQADYISEISVQFKNNKLVNTLKDLKKKGFRIFLVTDFFFSQRVIRKIIDYHDIASLFDDVFVSCELSESKEAGGIYPLILKKLKLRPEQVLMIGDNKKSDIVNAAKCNIQSVHTNNLSHHLRNKINLFGSDAKNFKKACLKTERRCKKSKNQFSEYIIHFYFFIERLYKRAKQDDVKNLFFLAREGLFLKVLFDFYQELNQFEHSSKINTHYLKVSRQSAHQITLKPLDEENFNHLDGMFGQMSLEQLLQWLFFSTETKNKIISELLEDPNLIHKNIFNSDVMKKLRVNDHFRKQYKANRIQQKEAFTKYLESFDAPIEEGISLVDVGWGGTMQECIYAFFEKKIPVTGYYIGLNKIYQIESDTKRFGLNFSIYPSYAPTYDILKANGQLYEQLLGAPYGSTLGYTFNNNVATTIEFHEENEKRIFYTYIKDIQNYMVKEFELLFVSLRPINYTYEMSQEFMTDLALRVGILSNKKKIRFINDISKGFYQNVGENKVGLAYNPNQLSSRKRVLLKRFLKSPEKVFRYLVKVKPYLYAKGLYWCCWPFKITYYYIKFNFWVKKTWFSKKLLR